LGVLMSLDGPTWLRIGLAAFQAIACAILGAKMMRLASETEHPSR
jgi:predicted signal transduction protein with EAL and GGDEF domain